MSGMQIALLVTQILGGLALFIFGMQIMSEALQRAAGNRLRDLLYHLTRNRFAGLGVGTAVAFLVHSSATTVMIVGFINAGLMSLEQSIAVILGANVGTTLSMQVISFKLDDYCYAAILVGLLLQLVGRRELLKNIGSVLLGFGLLFLGMRTMSAGVAPLKGSGLFEQLIAHTNGDTLSGLVTGTLLASAVTGIIQSSGAMIGMLFALASAGVFTEFSQVFPLILGAHIGTCATALLGCIGTNIEARRSAVAHVLFNVVGAIVAIAMASIYLDLVPRTDGDLVRQIANAHSMVQGVNALLFLGFTFPYARFVRFITPSRAKPPEKSHLEERYLDTPEAAIVAVLREMQRMVAMTRRQLRGAMRGFVRQTTEPFAEVTRTEDAVNTLKRSIQTYLVQLAARRLSKRQSVLVQHLLAAVSDIERIGDHAVLVTELVQHKVEKHVWFDDDSMAGLIELYRRASELLELTCQSLDPSRPGHKELAEQILTARAEYKETSRRVVERQQEILRAKEEDPLTGIFFSRFVTVFDKIVRHSKSIAVAELEPVFFVKPHKLDKKAELLHLPESHPESRLPIDEKLFDDD